MNYDKFKELLEDQHEWPGHYQFKFVVPYGQVQILLGILNGFEITQRQSSKGKYVSITAKKKMNDAQDVILIYKKVAIIEGIVIL